jgi:hypothetical protein
MHNQFDLIEPSPRLAGVVQMFGDLQCGDSETGRKSERTMRAGPVRGMRVIVEWLLVLFAVFVLIRAGLSHAAVVRHLRQGGHKRDGFIVAVMVENDR